ncbi:unnamed protein product [Pleuronectes platessa]|uniref:Uncharacterized protein n=1 Tax=Pleuronectes platessa TaxID=8262 RepID=A0A9N7VLZ6_PLEPL|nr:unnamed protein product [Pleuronectes platessa]
MLGLVSPAHVDGSEARGPVRSPQRSLASRRKTAIKQKISPKDRCRHSSPPPSTNPLRKKRKEECVLFCATPRIRVRLLRSKSVQLKAIIGPKHIKLRRLRSLGTAFHVPSDLGHRSSSPPPPREEKYRARDLLCPLTPEPGPAHDSAGGLVFPGLSAVVKDNVRLGANPFVWVQQLPPIAAVGQSGFEGSSEA